MTKSDGDQMCANCLYWREPECRRHAPHPENGSHALWPSTCPQDWCGEWVSYTKDHYD